MMGDKLTFLNLKKQRFLCKECKSTFIAKTPVVEKNCHISNQSKIQIIIKAVQAQFVKLISEDCSVSWHTVQREINKASQSVKSHHQALPENLSLDEFKHSKARWPLNT